MKRFLRIASRFHQISRKFAQEPNPKIPRRFNLSNQNHLSNLMSKLSMNKAQSWKEIDKEKFLLKYPNAQSMLEVFSSHDISEQSVMNIIKKEPKILEFNFSNVSSVLNEFQLNGFDAAATTTIIMLYPHVLQFKPNDISETMIVWKECHLGEKFIKKLFISYPLLLSLNDDDVKERLRRINYLMGNKINRTTNLLLRNPTIMVDDWNNVEDRFQYVLKEMRYLEKEISRCKALTTPLQDIILRHTFLEKCGVYVRPGLKDHEKGFDPHENPPLSKIIDTDDESFAKNVAKVSPEEFEVYKILMHYEERLEDEEDTELNLQSDFDLDD